MDFSEIIKKLRDKTGLTQKDFAEKIDVPLPTLKNIEGGKTKNFSVQILAKVIIGLGVTPNEAFGYDKIKHTSLVMVKQEIDSLNDELEEVNEKYKSMKGVVEKIQGMIKDEKKLRINPNKKG